MVSSSSVDWFQFRSQINSFDDSGDVFLAIPFSLAANNPMEKQCDRGAWPSDWPHPTDSFFGGSSFVFFCEYSSPHFLPSKTSVVVYLCLLSSFIHSFAVWKILRTRSNRKVFFSEERSKDTETAESERWTCLRFPFLKEEDSTRRRWVFARHTFETEELAGQTFTSKSLSRVWPKVWATRFERKTCSRSLIPSVLLLRNNNCRSLRMPSSEVLISNTSLLRCFSELSRVLDLRAREICLFLLGIERRQRYALLSVAEQHNLRSVEISRLFRSCSMHRQSRTG